MSIATEIQRLQEAKADIKTVIEEKGVEVGNGLIDGYADKVDAVYDKGVSDGKKAQHDEHMNAFIDNYNSKTWQYAFYNSSQEFFYPTKKIVVKREAQSMFQFFGKSDAKVFNMKERLIECGVTMDFSNSTTDRYLFYWTNISALPELDLSSATNLYGAFGYNYLLESIDKIILSDKCAELGVAFDKCTALKNIKFDGTIAPSIDFKDCTLLTKESITSTVNHLSDTATGQAVTFNKEAVNREFKINVDDASTFPEGSEFYKLRNSKANWTFNYI